MPICPLTDGQGTTIEFSIDTTLYFFPKNLTPSGWDGGGPNDVTLLSNTKYMTMMPKTLKTITALSGEAAYSTQGLKTDGSIGSFAAMVNRNQQVTVTYPDGAQFTFWGYLDKLTPNQIVGGQQPTLTFTIQPTMWDSDLCQEADPNYAAA